MDTIRAFMMGEMNRGKEQMVFDWEKAARLIKEHKPEEAGAGLRDDWEWTGGTIYRNGKPIKSDYTYLASTWAIPELDMDGEVYECWRMESDAPGWNCDTKWPRIALDILEQDEAVDDDEEDEETD